MTIPAFVGVIAASPHDSDLLLGFEHFAPRMNHFGFPFGDILPLESPKDAAVRVCKEKTGFKVALSSPVPYVTKHEGKLTHIYTAHILSSRVGSAARRLSSEGRPVFIEPSLFTAGTLGEFNKKCLDHFDVYNYKLLSIEDLSGFFCASLDIALEKLAFSKMYRSMNLELRPESSSFSSKKISPDLNFGVFYTDFYRCSFQKATYVIYTDDYALLMSYASYGTPTMAIDHINERANTVSNTLERLSQNF